MFVALWNSKKKNTHDLFQHNFMTAVQPEQVDLVR